MVLQPDAHGDVLLLEYQKGLLHELVKAFQHVRQVKPILPQHGRVEPPDLPIPVMFVDAHPLIHVFQLELELDVPHLKPVEYDLLLSGGVKLWLQHRLILVRKYVCGFSLP